MPKKQERRNGHAFHPIMKKGGVHEKSEKAKRAAAKLQTNKKGKEWQDPPSLFALVEVVPICDHLTRIN